MSVKRASPRDETPVEQLARRLWDVRERNFPKFTRLTWEQGTPFARAEATRLAERAFARKARDDDKHERLTSKTGDHDGASQPEGADTPPSPLLGAPDREAREPAKDSTSAAALPRSIHASEA